MRLRGIRRNLRALWRDTRVLVAVSGGKDSLALWHALVRLGYQADGMYIRLGIGGYSLRSQEKTEAFAVRHGLTLHQVDLGRDDGFTVPDLVDTRSGKPCSACGTVKRYHFNPPSPWGVEQARIWHARERGSPSTATSDHGVTWSCWP